MIGWLLEPGGGLKMPPTIKGPSSRDERRDCQSGKSPITLRDLQPA